MQETNVDELKQAYRDVAQLAGAKVLQEKITERALALKEQQ